MAFVEKARHLKITDVEFAYLKTIAFTTNNLIEDSISISDSNVDHLETTRRSNSSPLLGDFMTPDSSPSTSPVTPRICGITNTKSSMLNFFQEVNTQACRELFEHILNNNNCKNNSLTETVYKNTKIYTEDSNNKTKHFQCPKLEPEEEKEDLMEIKPFSSVNSNNNNNNKNINSLNNHERIKNNSWDDVCFSSSFDDNNMETNLASSVSPSLSAATTTTNTSLRTPTKETNYQKYSEIFSLAPSPLQTINSQDADDSDHEMHLHQLHSIKTASKENNNKIGKSIDNNHLSTATATVTTLKHLQFSPTQKVVLEFTKNESIDSSQIFTAVQRHSNLLQLLPCLRVFKEAVLVDLFFSGLIGNMSIETVIPFIYSMNIMQIFDKSTITSVATNLPEMTATVTQLCDVNENIKSI